MYRAAHMRLQIIKSVKKRHLHFVREALCSSDRGELDRLTSASLNCN